MNILKCIGIALTLILTASMTNAASIIIYSDQDTSLSSEQPYEPQTGGSNWLYVGDNTGDRDYQSMFGFDMSPLTSVKGPNENLNISSLSFHAYNNYNEGTGAVDISLGNTDLWDAPLVTWNSSHSDHGSTIDSRVVSDINLMSYISWDITSIPQSQFLTDNYITLYLSIPNPGVGNNWHDFEPKISGGNNEAYLKIEYQVSSIPIPAAAWLFGSALAGLGVVRRKK